MMWLVAVYRANPARPHCRPGHHVLLCRLLRMQEPGRYCRKYMTEPFCGPID